MIREYERFYDDFIKESLKYLLSIFFKHCKLLLKLLGRIQGKKHEHLLAELLLGNFRWLFQTLYSALEATEQGPFKGLSQFKTTILDMLTELNTHSSRAIKNNSTYYESTVTKITK